MELTKKELRKRKKAEKKAARKAEPKNGVSFVAVMLLVVCINLFWMGYIQHRIYPEVEANYAKYEEVITEYKRQIKAQDIIWRNREENWSAQLDQIEVEIEELKEMYENAVKIIDYYGGKTDFSDEE